MKLQLSAEKIWLASEPVDFRKSINGLSELVSQAFKKNIKGNLYIFTNRSRNKIKCLAYHRNGPLLIYKQLDKKKFTLAEDGYSLGEISEKELAWLIAGLDWINMSRFKEMTYDDYY